MEEKDKANLASCGAQVGEPFRYRPSMDELLKQKEHENAHHKKMIEFLADKLKEQDRQQRHSEQERRRRLFEEVAKGCQNEEFFALQNGSEEYVEKSGDVCQKKTRTIFLPKLDKLTFETLSKITEAIIDAADAFAIKTKEG